MVRGLVADGDAAFAREVAHLLRPYAEVETSYDGAEALAAVRARPFDFVVAEWLLPYVDGVSLLRCLRESGSNAPFVMCTVLGQREAREYALSAGADEVIVKPASAQLVASAALARCPAERTNGTPGPPGADPELARFCAKPAWRDAAKTLVKALSAATGAPLQEATASPVGPAAYDARVTLGMVDVRARIRVELGIFTTLAGGRDLVKRALGLAAQPHEADPDEVTEFLSEMCNQSLGALKSAMRLSGLSFTLLVPRMRFVDAADGWSARFPVSRVAHVALAGGVPMTLVVGARPCAIRTLLVPALRENMVLAEDLKDEGGAVLAEAATRLTANVLVRIKSRAPDRSVRIAD
jgi:CheY-like chemotaxis protein